MPSLKGLDIKDRVERGPTPSLSQLIYAVGKDLNCIGDLIGREFEIIYEGDKIKKVIQKPIKISQFMAILREAKTYEIIQNKMSKEKAKKHD